MTARGNENILAQSAAKGESLDLCPGLEVVVAPTLESFYTWGAEHCISAESIRNLLLSGADGKRIVDPKGVRIRGARIDGRLDLEGIITEYPLILDGCYIPCGINARSFSTPKLFLTRCYIGNADRSGAEVPLCVDEAHIRGSFCLNGTRVVNSYGPALRGDQLEVEGHMNLDSGVHVEAFGESGAIRLPGARIGAQLSFSGAQIVNLSGPGILGDHMEVHGSLYLNDRLDVRANTEKGAIRLCGALVEGQVVMSSSLVENELGPGLQFDGVDVGRDLFLDDCKFRSFKAIATVRLVNAKIGGQVSFEKSTIRNDYGRCIVANRADIQSNVFLDQGLKVVGCSAEAVVSLVGVQISGRCLFTNAQLVNPIGPGLDATKLRVQGEVRFDKDFKVCTSRGLKAVILHDANFGSLQVSPLALERAQAKRYWDVNGLCYGGYPTDSFDSWIRFLKFGTKEYSAHPYQQIILASRNAGHDSETRRASISQQADRLRRGSTSYIYKFWGMSKILATGYGNSPHRMLYWILSIFAIIFFIVQISMPSWTAASPSGNDCSFTDVFQISLSVMGPLSATDVSEFCSSVNESNVSASFTNFSIVVKILTSYLASVYISGISGFMQRR